nr:zinc finger, CCHC-type [Tanacetum cinerariifolium]
MPVSPAGQVLPLDVLNTHIAWVKASKKIAGLMLMTMDPDIKKNLKHLGAYDMLKELKTLYAQQADHELLQTVREFHTCKQEEGQSVSSYVLKMKSYIDNLEHLGHAMTQKLSLHKQTLPPKEVAPALHALRAGRIQKNQNKKSHKAAKGNQGKGKAKMGYALMPTPPFAPKPKNPPTPRRIILRSYLKELALKGLRGSRKLKPGALSLYVGDGHRAAVEATREFHLSLPSGLVLILHNFHYAPSITRGIILVLYLYKDGFVNRFKNDNSIFVSRNNLIYFNAIPRDDIYEIVLSSSNTNDSSMYAVSNKRAKLNLDSPLLWHCRLRHRRNKTLLDTVRSMMSQTTILKSVWDYARESTARILNMVSTKKFDKTPYEVWHGDLGEPANYKAALLDPESEKWLNVMNVEMQSIKDNEVWELVDLSHNGKTIGHKWLFKRKTDMDGAVHTYKARLTGYVFILNGGAFDWKSTKQSIFATSSTDAEYIAAFDASKEAVRIRKFIYGLGVVSIIEEPIMYYDNTEAITIAKDHGFTKGARHFRAKVHCLRETIEMGDVKIEKVDAYDNLADPFTNALAFPKHSELTNEIGMILASSLM